MRSLEKDRFICIDCEATGLSDDDRICEIAAVTFTLQEELESFETLIDPQMAIPEESRKIHGITDEMCKGKPKIEEVLPRIIKMAEGHIIVGHGIGFDLKMINQAMSRSSMTNNLSNHPSIDTLRLARLYGESPSNSLDVLRRHFNIEETKAHRAMDDVLINIQVFKKLIHRFNSVKEIFHRLKSPIIFKIMPLGKYKGRNFSEIPLNYLYWAIKQDYDQDLHSSIKEEIKKRKTKNSFIQASNPLARLNDLE